MKHYIFHLLLFSLCCLFFACENSLNEVEKVSDQLNKSIVETIKQVKILYSEEGKPRIELNAPLMLRHKKKQEPFVEFPEGIILTFFEDENATKIKSIISANYGIRYESQLKTILRDEVVWQNKVKNEQLETEELIWDERNKKIFSEKFITITTDTESILGEGFEANQEFTNYKIKKVTGTVQFNKKDLKQE